MPHRPRPRPAFDLAEERALTAAIEAYEEERRTLTEISDIARDLIEATEQYVKSRAEAAVAGILVEPGFDEAATLARLAEMIRLNDALDAELASDLKARIDRASSKSSKGGRTPRPPRTTGPGSTVH